MVGLAGCSAIKLGYNSVDKLAYWWLDSYFDFTEEQAALVREDIARLHAWHRSAELPLLADMVGEIELLAPADISASQACTFVTALRESLQRLANRAEPAVVTLATSLGDDQVRHVQARYEKNNTRFRDEWLRLTPAEQREKRYRQFLERSEMIYGRLDAPQREALRGEIERSIFDAQRIKEERQRRQQDAVQTLRKLTERRTDFDAARESLRGLLARFLASPDPGYREYQQALIEEGCRQASVLHNSTTPAQRESAVRRLRGYQRDLRELAEGR